MLVNYHQRYALSCICIAAAIGARKPATARHNDAFVSRDHSKSSVPILHVRSCVVLWLGIQICERNHEFQKKVVYTHACFVDRQ